MRAVFYKVLFTLELQHQLAPGKTCTAFGLEPTAACRKVLRDYRMEYRAGPGKLTVYYSGNVVVENEDPLESKIVPHDVLPDDTEFVFIVTLLERDIINKTVIPDSATIAVTDKKVAIPQSFITTSVVSLRVEETANTKEYEIFKVLNSEDQVISQAVVAVDDDGFYNCSADLRSRPSGIYSFALEGDNSLTQKLYVDTNTETSGHYGIIRLVKDNTWLMPDQMQPIPAMPDYNIFNYTFIKTP